ncbi:MAG TPA: hypothetical protein VGO18_16105, partial [Steroidobacteraceae bacterium]|nr:hypothetical protein [Steroidobacteraceae bacterium]
HVWVEFGRKLGRSGPGWAPAGAGLGRLDFRCTPVRTGWTGSYAQLDNGSARLGPPPAGLWQIVRSLAAGCRGWTGARGVGNR